MALQWYILQTHSAAEEQVKKTLEERIKTHGKEELFGEILVPTEQVVEMVKGERKTSFRKFYPGYILIHVELNNESWHLIKDTPKLTGFVGNDSAPEPLSDEEAMKIKNRVQDGALKPKPKVSFEEGDQVRVVEGPFANFQGVVDEVFPDKGRVRVRVSIFGRETPVELEYIQVSKG